MDRRFVGCRGQLVKDLEYAQKVLFESGYRTPLRQGVIGTRPDITALYRVSPITIIPKVITALTPK
jgi:hypothetical protein